jgi:NAD(P)-dependent dehydrogenase (short-subunit alcohol dehydrogenase family)
MQTLKTVVITGASKGIGNALLHIFHQNNYFVIGTSRTGVIDNLPKNNAAAVKLDLTDIESIRSFEKAVDELLVKIDILINNAAIGTDLGTALPDYNSFTETFATNVTGTVFFTEALLAHLNTDAKIINVSSKMGSIAMVTGTDSVAYRMSKTALNMYAKILANRLLNQHKVATIHPGWVRTSIAKDNTMAPYSPEQSAAFIFDFILSNFKTGIYWNAPEKSELEW